MAFNNTRVWTSTTPDYSFTLERARAHAGSMGITVTFERNDEPPKGWEDRPCVWGRAVFAEKAVRLKHNLEAANADDLKAWVLLHELGHISQHRRGDVLRGYIEPHEKSWSPARAKAHAIAEMDAWSRADQLARMLGIQVSERARAYGKRCIESHRRRVFEAPGTRDK